MAVNCQGLVGPFSPGRNVAVSCQGLMGPFSPGKNVNETISSGQYYAVVQPAFYPLVCTFTRCLVLL